MHFGKTLITGGLGFIGINILKKIIASSDFSEIVLLDSKEISTSYYDEIKSNPSIKFLKGSVLDEHVLSKLEDDFDYIIHTAAILGIKQVAEESINTLNVNIEGTKNCLEIARNQKNLKRFVLFSSSEIYGQDSDELDETQPIIIPSVGKRWCYAASKFTAEQYTKAYNREYGIPYTIIRPFNIFGHHRDGSNAMSTFINKALKNEIIEISGTGLQRRSWCYIDDFVDGCISAMSSITNETFNIGDPQNYITIFDLAKLIVNKLQSSSQLVISNTIIEDVRNRKPNVLKAQQLLNYYPSFPFEEGLQRTIDWIKKESTIV